MAWPSANVSVANVELGSNSISNARADIYDAFTKLNEIITEGPGGSLIDDPDPTLGNDLNVNGYHITSVGYGFVGINDTLIALDGVAAMDGDTSFSGNAVSITMAASTQATLKTNNNSTGTPSGVRLDISADQVNISGSPGTVKVTGLELSQTTGTPNNTSTPTGYIQVIINGTTRYMPYYT